MGSPLIGNKAFYRQVLVIALPIILQNLITNFVSMLDNVMVGQLSTAQIGAVTIVNNNLLFILNVSLFGAATGAGIFTTQFYGSQDQKGIRYTFRFKLLICMALIIAGCAACFGWSDALIGLYLQGDGDPALRAQTLAYGREYLRIMLVGMIPFAINCAYSGTLRECGYPTVPMVAGMIAMGVNLIGNYILIFGHFGAPQMGVAGAAVATVISRYVEMIIVVAWTHLNPQKNPYVKGLFRSFYIPGWLLKAIVKKGIPVLLNEAAYTTGIAFLNQCYSRCGLDVVPALSISTTLYNLSAVVFRSLGSAVGIIVGRMMGAGKDSDYIYKENKKHLTMGVISGVLCGAVTVGLSVVFPGFFNTTQSVRELATGLLIISAIGMPLQAYIFAAYFTLRAGGKTIVTLIFDSGAIWILMIPAALICTGFTNLPILVIYAICNAMDIIKCMIGYYFLRRRDWIQNLAIK